MSEWLRKLVEDWLPEFIDHSRSTRLLQLVFWPTAMFVGALFVLTNPIFGWFVIGVPVLFVWQTKRRGIGRVNPVLLLSAGLLALVPAFFLGKYRSIVESPTGWVLVGLLALLVWVAAFPAILSRLDAQRQMSLPPGHPGTEPFVLYRAEIRLLLVRLWTATMIMLVQDENAAAVVCAFALVYRRRWSAVGAGAACVVSPLLSLRGSSVVWEFGFLAVLPALIASYQWLSAARQPLWPRGKVQLAEPGPY